MVMADYCTKEGAMRLKDQIESYWADRGYDVRVKLVQGKFLASMRSARMDVRSDLVNGVPKRFDIGQYCSPALRLPLR